jgi:hypothetical protein
VVVVAIVLAAANWRMLLRLVFAPSPREILQYLVYQFDCSNFGRLPKRSSTMVSPLVLSLHAQLTCKHKRHCTLRTVSVVADRQHWIQVLELGNFHLSFFLQKGAAAPLSLALLVYGPDAAPNPWHTAAASSSKYCTKAWFCYWLPRQNQWLP